MLTTIETRTTPRPTRPIAWPALLAAAFALRAAAAWLVDWLVRRRADGSICIFPDADIYWQLGRAIRTGQTYMVMQWDQPHYALRAPGYPAFLAACQALFGESTLAARLAQAALGALGVVVTAKLAGRFAPASPKAKWGLPMVAAGLAAVDPFLAGTSALLLSEALFIPLMLLGQWGLAALWTTDGEGALPRNRATWVALATGLAAGAAVLTKPSWALFPPLALIAWVASSRGRSVRNAAFVAVGAAAIMAPWWVRNAAVCGRFVPTAQWMGASLYDGLSHEADGASRMDFLNEPGVRDKGEAEQDAYLRDRALDFAATHPRRVAELALIKAGRFWSPWPNADSLRPSPLIAWASSAAMVPLYVLILIGAWDRRRDARALILLAGPLLYFAAVHMVFVSSIRYRIPGEAAAIVLAAIGAGRLGGRRLAPIRA